MKRLPQNCSQMSTIAKYLVLAVGVVVVAGCATGDRAKKDPVAPAVAPAVKVKSVPLPAKTAVARLTDGREGFVITEFSKLDADTKADFDKAVAVIKEGDYQKGAELLEKVIIKKPAVTAPYIDLAIAYDRLNKPEKAEPHLKTALAMVPGHPLASNEYGLLLRKAGRFGEARTVFEQSLALFPEYFPVSKNLGILCDLYLKDLTCAQEQYLAYSKATPGDRQVKMWLADLQTRTGHYAALTGER